MSGENGFLRPIKTKINVLRAVGANCMIYKGKEAEKTYLRSGEKQLAERRKNPFRGFLLSGCRDRMIIWDKKTKENGS